MKDVSMSAPKPVYTRGTPGSACKPLTTLGIINNNKRLPAEDAINQQSARYSHDKEYCHSTYSQ